MRSYATITPRFWIGSTGRTLRQAGPEAILVALYLITCPHANMIGLYYLPMTYLAHETGLGTEAASEGLRRAIEVGFCDYDDATETIFVLEMARYQIGEQLDPMDKRCAGVQREYDALPDNRFLPSFFRRYASAFHMTHARGETSIIGTTSKAHRSHEQEQEQEQEQEHEQEQKQGKEQEGEARLSRRRAPRKLPTELPPDFQPNEQHRTLAEKLGVDVEKVFPSFQDYYLSRGVTLADWNRALSNWIRKEPEFRNQTKSRRTEAQDGKANVRQIVERELAIARARQQS